MYVSINDFLRSLDGGVKVSEAETAFPPEMAEQIWDTALQNRWIILGGDILTPELKYTYDNWFYDPKVDISLFENVKQSIAKSEQYITNYRNINGDNFMVVFVISNSYVEGTMGVIE